MSKIRDAKYWVINPLLGVAAGIVAGYSLEKSGIPRSPLDVAMQAGIPGAIGALEYSVKKYVARQENVNGVAFVGSSALGVAGFEGGNTIGRTLANLL